MERDPLRAGALAIVRKLVNSGCQAYLVGGCVRDELLGRPVKDYDIATSAKPEAVQALFSRTIPTGLQHGTVTVLSSGIPYEVTTFRREAGYEQFRRPTEVEYIEDITEDLARRDFTMNAMAMDADGSVLDPFGGRQDALAGVLRCVGAPGERFSEDALRMLRCLRFAAEYGLEVEQGTWDALLSSIHLLQHIAMERVRSELERMLGGSAPDRALQLLQRSRALRYTKSPLKLAALDEAAVGLPVLGRMGAQHPDAAWALLYLCIGVSAAEAADDMRRLTFAKDRLEAVRRIMGAHEQLASAQPAGAAAARTQWILAALAYGPPSMTALLELYGLDEGRAALQLAQPLSAAGLSAWLAQGRAWLQEMPASSVADLEVTGEQVLQQLGEKPGPWLGRLLRRLLESTALGVTLNRQPELLTEAERLYTEERKKAEHE